MISSEFKQHWDWAASRGKFQQDFTELNHVYDLMKACDCGNYLEIGTAEGNSLYILAHAASGIFSIDYGEEHTKDALQQVVDKLGKEMMSTDIITGDSTLPTTLKYGLGDLKVKFDCVLIDGGHDFATVLSDSILYAPLATKYIFWHDIQLPQVKAAVDWFVKRWKLGKYSEFINSETYGFGIMEVGK